MGQTLQSGHYIAYVKRRLEMEHSPKPVKKNGWLYNRKTAHDGKWFYTSDLTIKECSFEEVLNSDAYMLFYELLPWKNAGSLV